MNTKIHVVALGAMLLALCFPTDAQQTTRIPRVGFVTGGGEVNNPGPRIETFRQVLRDRG